MRAKYIQFFLEIVFLACAMNQIGVPAFASFTFGFLYAVNVNRLEKIQ